MTNKELCLYIIDSCNKLFRLQDNINNIDDISSLDCNIWDGVSYET